MQENKKAFRWGNLTIILLTLLLVLLALMVSNIDRLLPGRELTSTTITGLRIVGLVSFVISVFVLWYRHHVLRFTRRFWQDSVDAKQSVSQAWEKTRQKTATSEYLVLAIILLVGISIRLLFVTQPIRTDEANTYLRYASQPIYLALSDYAEPNNHLLHTLGVHLTTSLLGDSLWAIRLTALLAGILTIPVTYLLIRRLYDAHAGLLAAALIAVSSVMVEYATNARGYTLQTLILLLLIWLADHLRQRSNLAAWLAFSMLSALAFYTLPTTLYALGGVYLWLLFGILRENNGDYRSQQVKRFILSTCVAAGLTLLLYMPVFIVSGLDAIVGNEYVEGRDFGSFSAQIPQALADTWSQWHTDWPAILQVILAGGLILGLLRQTRQKRLPLLLFMLFWISLVLLVQRVIPFTRIWLFLLPIYLGSATAGLLSLAKNQPRFWRVATLVISITGAGLLISTRSPYTSTETGTLRAGADITQWLAPQLSDGDKVIYAHPSGEPLRYYFQHYDVDMFYILRDYTAHERLFLVVNTEYQTQSPQTVLAENFIDPTRYTEPEYLTAYEYAEVYLAERLSDAE